MSTNPVSMRLPIGIEGKAEPEVVETIQYHDDAITDLQQAIPKLKSQIDSLVTTVGAVTGSSSSSSGSSQSITNIINNIGFVNPQQGVTTYATQPSDEGALIILSDASPIAVTLTSSGSIPGITLPWYTFFLNLGSGTATLTPATGTISYPGNLGASSMPVVAEAMALVYFDGTNFWAATVAALSGSGTTGFVPVWTSSTALGDSHIDDGVTTPGVVTSSSPVAMKSLGIGVNTVIPDTITGYHGNGVGDVDIQMSDGTGTPTNLAVYDANGGLTDGGAPIFTKGGTILNPTGSVTVIVWYAPFSGTVTHVLGYVGGTSGSVINAQRNGLALLVSNLTLGSTGTWIDGGAVQNTAISVGDTLQIVVVSVSGSPTEIAIEIQCTRP